MRSRSQWSPRECSARSRLSQLLHESDVIAGSLGTMKRSCGKKGCRCARGEKHESLYIAFSQKGKRKMVFIPRQYAQEVTAAIEAYQRVKQLQQTLSDECCSRLLEGKSRR
jgi:hypothetical protein